MTDLHVLAKEVASAILRDGRLYWGDGKKLHASHIAEHIERALTKLQAEHEAERTLTAWDDDTALSGPDAPKWNGQIEHLIRYLLTVHKRFGNTAITADLRWGASALHKRDEQKKHIAQLEAERTAAVAETIELKRRLARYENT